jgi:hypothetical protein
MRTEGHRVREQFLLQAKWTLEVYPACKPFTAAACMQTISTSRMNAHATWLLQTLKHALTSAVNCSKIHIKPAIRASSLSFILNATPQLAPSHQAFCPITTLNTSDLSFIIPSVTIYVFLVYCTQTAFHPGTQCPTLTTT